MGAIVLEQVGEGVIIADASGRITFVNEAANRLHGVAELGVGVEGWSETYHLLTMEGEPYPPAELPLARALLKREAVRDALWRIRRPDGTEIVAQGTATPLRSQDDGAPLGAVLVLRDATERHRAQAALEEANRRTVAVLESTTDAFVALDRDWRITYVNGQAARFNRKKPEEFLGKTHWQEWPASVGTRMEHEYRRAMETQVPAHFEHRYVGEGHDVWLKIHAYPSPDGLSLFYHDITERKQAEDRQRAFLRDVLFSVSEHKLRLCDSASDLPPKLSAVCDPVELSKESLSTLRRRAREAAAAGGFPEERCYDLITAVSEAAMNAVVHAGGGVGSVCVGSKQTVQVWVEDHGAGIRMDALHRATLERGFTTKGTLGHGFWMILHTADRVWLLTGEAGTSVVIEQDRAEPEPLWLNNTL